MSSSGSLLLLLDTHVWVWLLNRDAGLACSPALDAIQAAAARGAVRVSVISVWEVGMLQAKGRIRFAQTCEEWVRRGLTAPGISCAALTPEIALASTRLPDSFHGDPADRLLVATARLLAATLVSGDGRIRAYGARGHVAVMPV